MLAQEASPPPQFKSVYRPIDNRDPHYKWGSAVVALHPDLILKARTWVPTPDCYRRAPQPGELPDSHPGACAVADVQTKSGQRLFTAISLYGQWEMMPGGNDMYACARVHRMLSDLTGIFAYPRRYPVVLAGDLNLTTQGAKAPETKTRADGADAVFARLRAWRLVDCIASTRKSRAGVPNCTCLEEQCSHIQTYRHNNRADSSPTQFDYAFVSVSLQSTLNECRVVDDAAAWRLSDHCPILLDLGSALPLSGEPEQVAG